jgi:flagellar protein FliO/FliZ
MPSPDPDSISWLRIGLAFTVVFSLMALLGLTLKYIQSRGVMLPRMHSIAGQTKRLAVVESFILDVQRRLVIVRCDDTEHLILLGNKQDMVIANHLKGTPTPCPPTQSNP